MTPQKNYGKMASSLLLVFILFGISLASATTENGYNNDNNFLTTITETTLMENGYKTSIIINPDIVGIHAEENGYKLDLAICPQGIGGALEENGYRLDLVPEKLFPDAPDIAVTRVTSSKNVVVEGDCINVNITLRNEGSYPETFSVTLYGRALYGNAWAIYTFTGVTLPSQSTTTLTMELGCARGFYTLSAYAWPVLGEIHTSDNTYVDSHTILVAPRVLTRTLYARPIPV